MADVPEVENADEHVAQLRLLEEGVLRHGAQHIGHDDLADFPFVVEVLRVGIELEVILHVLEVVLALLLNDLVRHELVRRLVVQNYLPHVHSEHCANCNKGMRA